jgi:predicted nucleic acid-binding protein
MFVVLDSTVLIADFGLNALPVKALLDLPKRGKATVVVPEVVILETAAHWRRNAEQAVSKFGAASRSLGQFAPELREFDLAEAAAAYETWLRSEFASKRVKIVGHPDVPHDVLVRAAIERRKPFSESGRGYRDALLWQTALKLADENKVALVTNNSSDFSDNKVTLAASLREDLVSAGLGVDRIAWYATPRDLTKVLVDPLNAIIELAKARLEDPIYFDDLGAQIVGGTDLDLPSSRWGFRSPLSSVPAEADITRAARLFPPSNITVIDAWPPEDDASAAQIEFEAECDLDVDWEQEPDLYIPADDVIGREIWGRSGSSTVTATVSVVAAIDTNGTIHDVAGSISII